MTITRSRRTITRVDDNHVGKCHDERQPRLILMQDRERIVQRADSIFLNLSAPEPLSQLRHSRLAISLRPSAAGIALRSHACAVEVEAAS